MPAFESALGIHKEVRIPSAVESAVVRVLHQRGNGNYQVSQKHVDHMK